MSLPDFLYCRLVNTQQHDQYASINPTREMTKSSLLVPTMSAVRLSICVDSASPKKNRLNKAFTFPCLNAQSVKTVIKFKNNK